VPSIVNICIRKIRAQTASIEYIQAVLDHIHNKVQEGNVDEVKGGKAVLAVVWATRWPHMASITTEGRIALEIMRADAISRLSMKAKGAGRDGREQSIDGMDLYLAQTRYPESDGIELRQGWRCYSMVSLDSIYSLEPAN
jgi:hypothetical protein